MAAVAAVAALIGAGAVTVVAFTFPIGAGAANLAAPFGGSMSLRAGSLIATGITPLRANSASRLRQTRSN